MEEPFGFTIPEKFPDVLRWFTDELRALCDVTHPGSPEMELRLEGPKIEKLDGPDGDTRVTKIDLQGFRTKGSSILSDFAPGCTAGWKPVWEPLGPVMQFRFSSLGGSTRVWASGEVRFSTVHVLLIYLLKQIEARYPMVGTLWQQFEAKLEMQRIERIEQLLKHGAGTAMEGPPQLADGMAADAAGTTTKGRGKPGRRRIEANEWARREMYNEGKDPRNVYPEWCRRYAAETGRRISELDDPADSFKKMLRLPPK